eukprot:327137-Hanusia_phi.AAC.6
MARLFRTPAVTCSEHHQDDVQQTQQLLTSSFMAIEKYFTCQRLSTILWERKVQVELTAISYCFSLLQIVPSSCMAGTYLVINPSQAGI